MADIIADEFARYPEHMRPVKAGERRDEGEGWIRRWSMDGAGEENARRAKMRETWIDPEGPLVGPSRTVERSPETQAFIDKMADDERAARTYLGLTMTEVEEISACEAQHSIWTTKGEPFNDEDAPSPRARRLTLTAQDSGYLVNTGADAGTASYHAFTTLDEAVEFMRERIA